MLFFIGYARVLHIKQEPCMNIVHKYSMPIKADSQMIFCGAIESCESLFPHGAVILAKPRTFGVCVVRV